MKKWIPALVIVSCVLLSGCVASDVVLCDSGPAREIGWLHGNCLALDDGAVRVGSEVAVVTLGEVQNVMAARVTGSADDAGECVALMDDRREANLGSGLAFYKIDADPEVELGIGIVQAGGDRELSMAELLDTDGDGRRDSFSHCTTSEGVKFSVWADEAGRGAPLWTGYYYLGYDTEADCPEGM